jgi:hypothetical protein
VFTTPAGSEVVVIVSDDVTVSVAEAGLPVTASFEVSALVVLIFTPGVVARTFTLKVHDALAARVAPVRLTLVEPAVAVIVPPPQDPVKPLGVATITPPGSGSLKPTPVNEVPFGFAMVKVRTEVPLTGMTSGLKVLPKGGDVLVIFVKVTSVKPETIETTQLALEGAHWLPAVGEAAMPVTLVPGRGASVTVTRVVIGKVLASTTQ